jgi:hypothetical protein
MQRMTLVAAVVASGAGFVFGQDPPASTRRPGPESADRIAGQVVATDAPRRVLTLRAMSRLPATVAATATPAKPVVELPETFRLTVSDDVARQLVRYKQGDWVEVTCGRARGRAAGDPAAEATPPAASTGTGARPGTGTTGVGTTGTGISGTGTPSPSTTPADEGAAAARIEVPRAAEAAYESPLARWVREKCGVVTAVTTPGAAASTPR